MSDDSGTSEDKLSSEEDEDRDEIQIGDAIDASKNDVPKWNNAEVDKDDPVVEQDGTDDNGDRETESGGANSGKKIIVMVATMPMKRVRARVMRAIVTAIVKA